MSSDSAGTIRAIDMVDNARARRLSAAPNVRVIRQRKTGRIVEIQILDQGGSWDGEPAKGDPRRYSHDHETRDNPAQCWTLRRLFKNTESLYRLAVTDCLRS